MKPFLKWAGIILVVLVAALAVVPFLIPVRPLEGLVPVAQLAGPGDRFVTLPFEGTDGIDIRYVEAGDTKAERAIILMHGSLFNAATWDEVIPALAPYGRVIAYDQAPYGLSEKPAPGSWTGAPPLAPAANVARLFQLMDALGIDRVVLVGNSYGATFAVQSAAAEPDRVEALVLGDAAVFVNESFPGWLMQLPQVDRLGPLLARAIGASDTFVDATWAHPDAMSDARRAKTLIHTRAENWDLGFWSYLQNWKSPPLDAEIASLAQPVLVLTGDRDTVVPVSDSERLHEMIPASDFVVLPDCGHVPQEECPDAYAEAVTGWLAKLPY